MAGSAIKTKNAPLRCHNETFIPDFYLRVTFENRTMSCQSRMSVLVNGTSPGPTIHLMPGKTSWVRVCNDMDIYNTTMIMMALLLKGVRTDASWHWHGLSQRTATFSDGSPFSQWPLAPHRCFDYEIHPEVDDSGTCFYHSHVGFLAMTTAGPLIVEDAEKPPYKYSEEKIVFLQDYYNKTDSVIEHGLTATPFMWSGETNAVLVNGAGVAIGEMAGKNGCEMPVIDVEPGKTYRLRFVGALAISMVSFGIEGHEEMEVIAVDGHYTKAHHTPYMQISPGQRFDALLHTKDSPELVGNPEFIIQLTTNDRPSTYTGFGILRYSNASQSINTFPAVSPL